MTATMKAVCHCDEPIRDNAHLCTGCGRRLQQQLAEIPNLLDEVQTTRLRLSRTGAPNVGVTSRSSDTPLPYNDGPLKASSALHDVLRRWTEVVVDTAGAPWPRDMPADLSRFLLKHLRVLRRHEQASVCYEQLTHTIGWLRGTVDRPADLTYAGICSAWVVLDDDDGDITLTRCPTHLYVPFGRRTVKCGACDTEHDMAQRREVLLAALEDQLAHVALLSQGLSNLGRELNESTVRSWVFRKRLAAHGQDDLGRELYRVGDVLDLMRAEAVRQAELAAKRDDAEAKARRRKAG